MPQDEGMAREESRRILDEYQRRREEVDGDLYAPWNTAEQLIRDGRRRLAAALLRKWNAFPGPDASCLEVGYGELGWLGDLINWGVPASGLHGIELDDRRSAVARARLPTADLRVGDAADLPWQADTFQLVVVSTVFTSVLDDRMRQRIAQEITRVLAPGGAILWYDFAFDNPKNPHVRRVGRKELFALFPTLSGEAKKVTLAPPLLRRLARLHPALAMGVEAVAPCLRSHLLAVLVKAGEEGT